METLNLETPAVRASYWKEMVLRYRQSGLSRLAFCRRENLKDHCLAYWVRKLQVGINSDEALSPNFIDLSQDVRVERDNCVELEFPSGMILRVRG